MHFVIFTHSLVSDWNHGNAHFLRGVATDLVCRGNRVDIYEPGDGWSRQNLIHDRGEEEVEEFEKAYPLIRSRVYDQQTLDLDEALRGADVVLVHEWNSHNLVWRIGRHRAQHPEYRLLFHDTHHRSATDPSAMAAYDLSNYDGVLAYGNVIRDLYIANRWARRVWTWHEAADTRVFKPLQARLQSGDLVWIGNWGDDERTKELREYLIEPVKALELRAKVYGVRYPQHALDELHDAGIEYGGWLPNYLVPQVFAQHRVTIHVPRRPYTLLLPGIPTIRPFEALACSIPLISAPWSDQEELFREGKDYLSASNGAEMVEYLKFVLSDATAARASVRSITTSGLETIQQRHTCAHRVDELLAILSGVNA